MGDKNLLWQCGLRSLLVHLDGEKCLNLKSHSLSRTSYGIPWSLCMGVGAFRGIPLSVIQKDWKALLF